MGAAVFSRGFICICLSTIICFKKAKKKKGFDNLWSIRFEFALGFATAAVSATGWETCIGRPTGTLGLENISPKIFVW